MAKPCCHVRSVLSALTIDLRTFAASINKELAHTGLRGFSCEEELILCRIGSWHENTMNAQDIVDALRRYLRESEDDRRETSTKIGISWITLSAWLADEGEPHKRI